MKNERRLDKNRKLQEFPEECKEIRYEQETMENEGGFLQKEGILSLKPFGVITKLQPYGLMLLCMD